MTPIKVFFVEPTGKLFYHQSFECKACNHITRLEIGEVDGPDLPKVDWDATRHPCEKCGVSLRLWSAGGANCYRRADTGEELGGRQKLPPGACYELKDYTPDWCGADGRALAIVCPDGHHWHIDSRASNCTKPDDKVHRCWVRHGKPEDGTLHVDKNGNTCSAGAGSIMTGRWHGFLRNGFLVDC